MKDIQTTIDIAGSSAHVWAVLADMSSYPGWNLFITSISGPLRVGESLTVYIAPPGGKGMTFKPRVLTVEPERELRWRGKLLVPGLFDGEHYFRIESSADGVRFHHGERFSGLLVSLMPAFIFEQTKAGFEAMNLALKQRVES